MTKKQPFTKLKKAQRLEEVRLFNYKEGITNSLMAKYMPSKEFKIINGSEEASNGTKIG